MELTKLKSVISSGLENILLKNLVRKRRSGNRASASLASSSLGGQKNSANAGSLVVKQRTDSSECQHRQDSNKWVHRSHMNDQRFRVSSLQGRKVVFSVIDDQGDLREYQGVVASSFRVGSALFRLEGEDQVFNSNFFAKFAVAVS